MRAKQFTTEAAIGTNPKRPSREGSRPERGHEPQKRYVTDRKTGKQYDPEAEFDKLKNSDDFKAQMKRMSQKEGFDYTMKDLGNDYAGFPSNHSLKHKMMKRISPEHHQLYKDKINNTHDSDQLVKLFHVAKARGHVIDESIERQHGDIKPWAYWQSPERVAQKLYKIHGGEPIGKDEVKHLWKVDGPDRMTKFMLKPDMAAILSNYQAMSAPGDLLEGWTKLPSGDYQNSHTGVRSSNPPAKKKRGQKTGAEWDAIEKAKKDKEQAVAEGTSDAMANAAKRLTDPNDGKVAKLRAAGDKRREEHLKSRDIAKKNEAIDRMQAELEEAKAPRALCKSSTPDEDLGASQLSSCKSQGLRARDGNKSHKLGKSSKSRVKVGGKRIKGNKYGGPLPDWS